MIFQLREYYQNFKIFFTFLLLWVSVQFGNVIEDLIAYFMVITVGIMHGANDLLLLSKIVTNRSEKLKNIISYLLLILCCITIYFVNAQLAIFLFIVISAYHFGEEQLEDIKYNNLIISSIFFVCYGLLLFCMLFYNSLEEVNPILIQLTDKIFEDKFIKYLLYILLVLNLLFAIFYLFTKVVSLSRILEELFYLGLLFLVFKSTSLILGFAVYFIFWHSIPSIRNQIIFLSGDLTKQSILQYFKKALVFWLISILFILFLYFKIPKLETFATVIFVMLFAVTAPHIWVIYKMKK